MADDKDEMSPMLTILRKLDNEGYDTQFKVEETGLISLATQETFQPSDVEIVHFYRFEGESSTDDSSIVYAIKTSSGEKGTLTDAYGSYSEPLIEEFIKKVEAIKK